MKITCCTKDCPNRHPGCHGECSTYQEQRRLLDAENNENRKQRELNRICKPKWKNR